MKGVGRERGESMGDLISKGVDDALAVKALRSWRSAVVPVDGEQREAQRARTIALMERAIATPPRRRIFPALPSVRVLLAAVAGVGLMTGMVLAAPRWMGSLSAPVAQSIQVESTVGAVVTTRGVQSSESGADRPGSLMEGDEVSTLPQGSLRLGLPGDGTVELGARSELRIEEVQPTSQRLRLSLGRVDVSVPKSSEPHRLVIATPSADVTVVGTRFSVDVARVPTGSSVTKVSVSRGVVRVSRAGAESVFVRAGESWSSEMVVGGVPAPVSSGSGPVGEAATSASSVIVAPRSVSPTTTSASRPLGRSSAAPRRGAGVVDTDVANTRSSEAASLAEQNSVFRSALDARNAGDDARSVGILDGFLRKFPSSPLIQEAKVERFRGLARLGQRAEAARSARHYLAEYGAGFAREEARDLVLQPAASSSMTPTGRARPSESKSTAP